jgi:pyrroline-5-carboxylate reductase
MGGALVRGALAAMAVAPEDVWLFDVIPAASQDLARATGANQAASLAALATATDTVLLCTKPLDIPAALGELASTPAELLVISIAAGVTLATLEAASPERLRVIRAMPNTPALVHAGAAAWAPGTRVRPADGEAADRLLGSVGKVVQVPERLLDAVTGLSGSGPAYAYLMIEALADGGVRQGLGRAAAIELAAQTLLGAAKMVLETGEHPSVLKDMVTSPGGTTIAGLAVLERQGVRSALIEAVSAATQRAAELGATPAGS